MLVWKANFDRVKPFEKLHQRKSSGRPHTHDYGTEKDDPTHHLDMQKMPKDTVTKPPNVVNVAPRLFHRSEPHHGTGAPPTSSKAPLEPTEMSPQLTNTLEHIVGQLDILTQVQKDTIQVEPLYKGHAWDPAFCPL